jgi:transketolase
MAAMINGMLLHGGFRVFGATFFVFSDYCRPAIRLAALMGLPAIYVFTHDSFYVGEDGPTHEPVEQLAGVALHAQCDGHPSRRPDRDGRRLGGRAEEHQRTDGPAADAPEHAGYRPCQLPGASNLEKGAYTLWQNGTGTPELTLIATGSEVELALAAARQLTDVNVRVVSMPSWEFFEAQTQTYRDKVLDPACTRRLAIEAAASFGWSRYVGTQGATVTIDHFGASAPYKALAKRFGFTVENVLERCRQLLA